MRPTVYIRVEASAVIGLGHLVRCIALAQMIAEAFKVVFCCKALPESFIAELSALDFQLVRIREEQDFLSRLDASCIVVLDHYDFDDAYQGAIKSKGAKLVCLDDINDKTFLADVILNQAPLADASSYRAALHTQYAFGLDYVLLRPVFLEAAKMKQQVRSTLDVVVCFGGADPKNITQDVVQVLQQDQRFRRVDVIVGAAYGFLQDIMAAVEGDNRFTVHHALGEVRMCALLSEAGLAIVPASGVLQEALATGCSVISGLYVENQVLNYNSYLALGAFESAQAFEDNDLKNALDAVLTAGGADKKWIDGQSGLRVLKLFQQLVREDTFFLARAGEGDLLRTFSWANDATIRKYSFSHKKITLEEHRRWYIGKINNKNCFYYLGVIGEQAVGSIRFDVDGDTAVISYFIDPAYHQQGLGLMLLKKGVCQLVKERHVRLTKLVGMVMVENVASVKAFERLGYKKYTEQGNYKFVKTISDENRVI